MEIYAETAMGILDELHTERLDYHSEYVPLADAINRLATYEETGLSPEEIERILDSYGRGMTLRTENAQRLEIIKEIPINRLRELAQAEKTGQLAKFPFIAMVERSLRDGTMKPMSDQKHNGRYAVVYKSERWTSPLIDICGTPYNTEQAVERMHVVSREAAEAALKEREAIQNVLDKQDKG